MAKHRPSLCSAYRGGRIDAVRFARPIVDFRKENQLVIGGEFARR
jgi:hypothetical protein